MNKYKIINRPKSWVVWHALQIRFIIIGFFTDDFAKFVTVPGVRPYVGSGGCRRCRRRRSVFGGRGVRSQRCGHFTRYCLLLLLLRTDSNGTRRRQWSYRRNSILQLHCGGRLSTASHRVGCRMLTDGGRFRRAQTRARLPTANAPRTRAPHHRRVVDGFDRCRVRHRQIGIYVKVGV